MALIDVTIANVALQKIGAEDTVVDPEQDSFAGRSVRAAWDEVRQAVLRGADKFRPKWNFARRFAQVAARTPTPEWPVPAGHEAVYPLPADCIRFLEIAEPHHARDRYLLLAGPSGTEIAIRVPGPLSIWYLTDIVEPARWDSLFRDAFAARLGFQLADRITGDMSRKQACWGEFLSAMKAATGADASEGAPVEPEESDWVMARYGACHVPGGFPR